MSKTDFKKILYTKENSRLAAYLQGDPNEVHINNRFGKIIAPGLMQLAGFIARVGWRPRNKLEVNLSEPLIVPSKAYYDNLDFLWRSFCFKFVDLIFSPENRRFYIGFPLKMFNENPIMM